MYLIAAIVAAVRAPHHGSIAATAVSNGTRHHVHTTLVLLG